LCALYSMDKFCVQTVDLASGKIESSNIEKNTIKEYLGGRGLGAQLYSQNPLKADNPENSFFIVPGLLTGTAFSSSSRLNFVSSSPLTGWMLSSSAGGNFGAYLKSIGMWALEVKGRSDKWVYLEISKEGIKILDAKDLAGKNVYETRKALESRYDSDKISVAVIGRGGENLVKFSIVQFDKRAAGRSGSGWHFGFKKLKAIVVKAGDLPVTMADSDESAKILTELMEKKAKHEVDGNVETYCTAPYVEYANEIEAFPASNYRRNSVSKDELKGIGMPEYEKRTVKKESCWSCPLACTRLTKGKYSGEAVKGPEYETLWSLGANCDNFDLDVLIECNRLCDDYGLDTISTGSILGWYKECFDKGLVKKAWSPERMFDLIKSIGDRKGEGKKLAEGVLLASKAFSFGEEFVSHSKGLELPAWDPRSAIGMAVAYATSPTGGDHCKGWTVSYDVDDPKGRFSTEGKVENVIDRQNMSALMDALGTCMFADFMYGEDMWARCISAFMGIGISEEELKACGERIFQLEHKINVKLGQELSDNDLPDRIIGYEIKVAGKKVKLTREMFDKMMAQYYELRKWK